MMRHSELQTLCCALDGHQTCKRCLRGRENEHRNYHLESGVINGGRSVSKSIVKLAKAAGIKVDEKPVKDPEPGEPDRQPVYASAHDLRRAFGYRWARRVMPMVLKEMMRHASVQTTEQYYVRIEAQETDRFLREVPPTKKRPQQKAETL